MERYEIEYNKLNVDYPIMSIIMFKSGKFTFCLFVGKALSRFAKFDKNALLTY